MNETNKITLEERKKRAAEYHAQGYNCAQCLVKAFEDIDGVHGLVEGAVGLGGGVCGLRQICGVVSAMALLEGYLSWHGPADKLKVYSAASALAGRFAEINGSMICADLKGRQPKTCRQFILDGVDLYYNHLNNHPDL